MGENFKVNERCIKGNTTYFKIKIDGIIEHEINKLGVDEVLYQKFNSKISEYFTKFTDKLISGSDFNSVMTNLRDEIIAETVKTEEKSSSKMRPFFKDYIFDKIYTMGINIKKGVIPDDCEKELEEARKKAEDEEKQKEEERNSELEKEAENQIDITVNNEVEEKDPDIVDQMWSYFFGGPSSSSSKIEKKPNTEKDKNKVKGD